MIITESGDFCRSLKGTVIENLKRHYFRTGYKVAKILFFKYNLFDQIKLSLEPIFDILPQARDTKMGGVIQRYFPSFFGRPETYFRHNFRLRT